MVTKLTQTVANVASNMQHFANKDVTTRQFLIRQKHAILPSKKMEARAKPMAQSKRQNASHQTKAFLICSYFQLVGKH